MKNLDQVHVVHSPEASRRDFLRTSTGVALTAALGGFSLPAAAAYVPPTRKRGSTVRNVKNYGAYGDGRHDDTAAIQRAINSLPSTGGTVYIPAGTYLIDATKNVRLRSLMHLKLDRYAKLLAKANSASRSYVVNAYRVTDVEISGGQIIGERDRHLGTSGEWGHCLMIRGCKRVTVRDIRLSKAWGDGMSIGATDGSTSIISEDVVVANIVSTGNRRQALTIGRSRYIKVYDSEFAYTSGIKPGCGIDIEPDPFGTSLTDQVRIQNCYIHHNAGNGIQVYKQVRNVTITGNRIERNKGYGVLAITAKTGSITNNRIAHNRLYGVGLRLSTSYYTVSGNKYHNNKTMYFGTHSTSHSYTSIYGLGTANRIKASWHCEVTSDCYGERISTNYYAQ